MNSLFRLRVIVPLLLAISLLIVSCSNEQDIDDIVIQNHEIQEDNASNAVEEHDKEFSVIEKTEEIISDAKKYTDNVTKEFATRLDNITNNIDNEYSEFKKKLSEMDKNAKEQYEYSLSQIEKKKKQLENNIQELRFDETLNYLEEKRKQLSEKLIELKNASAEKWQKTKNDLSAIIKEINEKLDSLKE